MDLKRNCALKVLHFVQSLISFLPHSAQFLRDKLIRGRPNILIYVFITLNKERIEEIGIKADFLCLAQIGRKNREWCL